MVKKPNILIDGAKKANKKLKVKDSAATSIEKKEVSDLHQGHKARFELLLDDSILGVRKK